MSLKELKSIYLENIKNKGYIKLGQGTVLFIFKVVFNIEVRVSPTDSGMGGQGSDGGDLRVICDKI